ncbi:MAG TPA: hypothetical protein VFJ56_00115, partial [Nitrospira sp.]|nr:hypothetical protein [Nitrospira sp.]
ETAGTLSARRPLHTSLDRIVKLREVLGLARKSRVPSHRAWERPTWFEDESRKGSVMDEIEEGKQKFLEVVKGVDPAVQVVIPVTPSNSMFLISLTKGPNRKFITVPEDDIIDLPNEADILTKVTKTVKDAVAALS